MDLHTLTESVTQTILEHRLELRKFLRSELREFNSDDNPLRGFCYFGAEAVYHLGGGRAAGLTPCVMRLGDEGETHWWVQGAEGAVYDPTAGQYSEPPDYSKGRGCGFQTEKPSKRAQVLIDLVLEAARRGRS
jgi:hypothetical protein